MTPRPLILCMTLWLAAPALADPPEIVEVAVDRQDDRWRFDVTLRHPDTGWDHYADGWEVLAPDGTRLGFRELFHPHEDEQPFTRSLGGVEVPEGTAQVIIRARCNRDGWADATVTVDLPR